jgi:WD40 repeat protein
LYTRREPLVTPDDQNQLIDQPAREAYEKFRYMVFVSYTHKDNRSERLDNPNKKFISWADWIQENLETYKIPEDLKGSLNDRGEVIPGKVGPVFRDETDLPATGDLPEKVREALSSSRFLVVICSRRAASTYWMNEEIRFFKELGRRSNILPFIVDGEPGASVSGDANITKEQECFVPALLHPLSTSGRLDINRIESLPLGADVRRRNQDGLHEITRSEIKTAANLLERGKLKLLAGILGIDLGRLIQREKNRQIAEARRRARIARRLSVAFGVLAIIAVAMGGIAMWQRNVAREESQRAIRQLVRTHLYQADQLFNEGETERAIAHISAAARLEPNNLYAALRLCRFLSERVIPNDFLDIGSPVKQVTFSQEGTKLLTVSDNGAQLWNLSDKSSAFPALRDSEFSADIDAARFGPDAKTILTAGHWHTTLWDVATGKTVSEPLDERYDTEVLSKISFLSADGKMRLFFPEPHAGVGAGSLVVLDSLSSQEIAEFKVLGNSITAQFSPDSQYVLVSSGLGPTGNAVEIWNLKTRKPVIRPIRLESPAFFAQFTPDSQQVILAANGSHPMVMIAGLSVNEEAEEPLKFDNEISDIAINPRGVYIVTAEAIPGDKARVQIWYASSLNPASEAIDLPARVTELEFNPDGTRFLTVTKDRKVQLWDSGSAAPLGKPFFHPAAINNAKFSKDGRRIATACDDGIARIWDTTSAVPVELPRPLGVAQNVQFAPGCSQIVGLSRGQLVAWNRDSGKMAWESGTNFGDVSAYCINPKGDKIVTASGNGVLKIWDLASGKSDDSAIQLSARVTQLVMTTDGKYIVAGIEGGVLEAWDLSVARRVFGPVHERGEITAIKICPRNESFLTVSRRKEDGIKDSVACLWSSTTWTSIGGEMPGEWIGSENPFSSDGQRMLTVSRSLKIRDTRNGRLLVESDRKAGSSSVAIFSPDGSQISSGSFILDAFTGKLLSSVNLGASMAFSPDGTKILAAPSGTARLWNSRTGRPISEPLDQENVEFATFDPRGLLILTSSYTDLRLWDVESGSLIYPAQPIRVNQAQFDQSGSTVLLSSQQGGPCWIWDLSLPNGPVPTWFAEFAESVAGWHVDNSGVLERMQTTPWDLKAEALARSADDAYLHSAKIYLGVGKVPFPAVTTDR